MEARPVNLLEAHAREWIPHPSHCERREGIGPAPGRPSPAVLLPLCGHRTMEKRPPVTVIAPASYTAKFQRFKNAQKHAYFSLFFDCKRCAFRRISRRNGCIGLPGTGQNPLREHQSQSTSGYRRTEESGFVRVKQDEQAMSWGRIPIRGPAPPNGLQRFHSCCIPKPQMPSGFFTKKKPPSATVKYGYMYCGTALKARIRLAHCRGALGFKPRPELGRGRRSGRPCLRCRRRCGCGLR